MLTGGDGFSSAQTALRAEPTRAAVTMLIFNKGDDRAADVPRRTRKARKPGDWFRLEALAALHDGSGHRCKSPQKP